MSWHHYIPSRPDRQAGHLTLILQSGDDHVVAPDNAPYTLEHIAAEDKKLVWLEECYHVATLDNEKERIAEETARFIQVHV